MSIISGKVYRPSDGFFTYDDGEPFLRQNHHFDHQQVVAPHAAIAAAFSHLPATTESNTIILNPTMEWEENPEAYVAKVQVPGLKKEEVKVEIEEGGYVLCITGERKVEREERSDNWCRVERSSRRFVRRFRLPEKAKAEKMKAHMENELLTITIHKNKTKISSKTIHIF